MSAMINLILDQLETMSDDSDRSSDECRLLKIHVQKLRMEFSRLYDLENKIGLRESLLRNALTPLASAHSPIKRECLTDADVAESQAACKILAEEVRRLRSESAWTCPHCRQKNSAGQTTCGRCDDL